MNKAFLGIIVLFFSLFSAVLFSSSAHAATGINQQLNFQGKVVNASGNNIADGTYNMEFKVYQDGTGTGGGTLKWTEDYLVGGSGGVTVSAGTFNVRLGSNTAFANLIDWNQDTLYLSFQVGNTSSCTIVTNFQTNCSGDGEMSPYIRLTAVPYAMNANKVGGLTASQLVQLTPGSQQTGSINVSSDITSGGQVKANTLDAATSGALTVGSSNATSIALAKNTTLGSGLSLALQGTNALTLGSTTAAGGILYQDGTVNNRTVTLTTPALTNSYSLSFAVTGASGNQCLQSTGGSTTSVTALQWGSCGGAVTLQNAYDAASGNTITTTNARDLTVTLADNATDSNLLINAALNSTSKFNVSYNSTSVLQVDPKNNRVAVGNTSFTPVGLLSVNGSNDNAFTISDGSNGSLFNADTNTGFLINNGITSLNNDVSNPSFEATVGQPFSGWNGASVVTNGADSRTGQRHYELTSANDINSIKYYEVTPGDSVYFEGYMKASAGATGSAGFFIQWFDYNKASVGFSNAFDTSYSTSYAPKTISTTAPAGAVYARINMTYRTGATGTFYYDDIYMSRSSDPSAALFKNTVNSTTAFQIQNAAGSSNLLIADTTNNKIGIGAVPTVGGGTLQVGGNVSVFGSVEVQAAAAGTQVFGGWVTGDSVDRYQVTAGGTVSWGPGNANTDVSLARTGVGALAVKSGTNSTTAFQVQNASGTSLLTLDTTYPSNNLITDGGFETGFTNWTGTNGTLSQSSTQAWQQTYSLKMVESSANSITKYTYNALAQNTTYSFDFMNIAASQTATFNMGYIYNGVSTDVCTGFSMFTVWARLNCTFTTPNTTSTNNAGIYIKDTATGNTYYIDGAVLSTGSTVRAFTGYGSVDINGTVTSPLVLQNKVDSTSALSVATSAGNSILRVDTSNSYIAVGDTTAGTSAALSVRSVGQNASVNIYGIGSAGTDYGVIQVASGGTTANPASRALIIQPNGGNVGIGALTDATASSTLTVAGTTAIKTTSTTAFLVQSASAADTLFTADTTNNRLKVGNATASAATDNTLFVVDSATTALLPAAVNGGIIYDSTTGKMKIIEGGNYKTLCNTTDLGCGAGGTTTLQTAYNATSGNTITTTDARDLTVTLANTATDSNFLINTATSSTSKFATQYNGVDTFSISNAASAQGSALFKNATNNTTAFQIQNAAGTETLFTADTSNLLLKTGSNTGLSINGLGVNQATTNIVTNPSFETDVTTGWNSYWTPTSRTQVGSAAIGNYAQQVVTAGSSTKTEGAEYPLPGGLATGKYTFSVYLKANAPVDILFGVEGNLTADANSSIVTVGTTWQRYTYTANVSTWGLGGSINSKLRIVENVDNAAAVTFQMDGVLYEASAVQTSYTDTTRATASAVAEGALDVNGALKVLGNATFNSAATFKSTANSTTAFQVQRASSSALLTADSTNNRIIVGTGGTATAQFYQGITIPATVTGSATAANGLQGVRVQGNYAYAIDYASSLLLVYDVSNPASPNLINASGTTTGVGSNPQAITVSGKYAYVVMYTTNKLGIFDISNPKVPVLVSTTAINAGPLSVTVSGRYAYVASGNTSNLSIVDISDPSNPVSVNATNNIPSALNAVTVQGKYAYTIDSGVNGNLRIFDLSNPAAASLPTSGAGPNIGDASCLGGGIVASDMVAVQGRYAYATNCGSNTIKIYDVKDPSAAPTVVGTISTGTDGPIGISVQGRYAYVAFYTNSKVGVYDISTPASPVSVGTYALPGSSGPLQAIVSGRYLFAPDWQDFKLNILDLGGAYVQQLETGGIVAGNISNNGDESIVGNLSVRGGTQLSGSTTVNGSLGVSGQTLFKNDANSAIAFQIQNASSAPILNVNTTNSDVTLTQGTLYVKGLTNPSTPTVTTSTSGGSLPTATNYYYQLSANGPGGESAAIQANVYPRITGAGATNSNTISWSAVANATGYYLYRSTDGINFFGILLGSGATNYTDISNAAWSTSRSPNSDNLTGAISIGKGSQIAFDGNSAAASSVWTEYSTGGNWQFYNNNAGQSTFFHSDNFKFFDVTSGHANFTMNNTGAATFQNGSNSATAFQVQNATGASVLAAGTIASNLVTNGSFESNSNAGWVGKGTGTIAASTTQKLYGSYSGLVTTTASADAGVSYPVALAANTQYTLSFQIRSPGVFSTMNIGYQNVNGTAANDFNCLTGISPPNNAWYRLSCTFTTAATVTNPNIFFKQTDATARTFYVDGVLLVAGATSSNYSEGNISIASIVNNPLTIQSQEDTSNAFQVLQNVNPNMSVFSVDSTNNSVSIGSVQSGSNAKLLITTGSYPVIVANSTSTNNLLQLQQSGTDVFTTTSTGATTLKNSADSAAAFVVQNNAAVALLSVNSSTKNVIVGSTSTNTNPVLLTLNNYSNGATEPTAVEGGMYYNKALKTFRCAITTTTATWSNCGGFTTSITNASTIGASSTAENAFTTTAAATQTVTLPADFCQPGRVIKVHAQGYYTDTAATVPSITFRLRLDSNAGTLMGATAAVTPASAQTNAGWLYDDTIACKTAGVSGTVDSEGMYVVNSSTQKIDVFTAATPPADITVNTTTTHAIVPTAQFSISGASNAAVLRQFTITASGP